MQWPCQCWSAGSWQSAQAPRCTLRRLCGGGAGCEDRAIRVWRVRTGAVMATNRAEVYEVAAWTGHIAPVSALRWFPRRMAVASASPDGATLMWMPALDALRASAAAPFSTFPQHLLAAGKL